MSKTKATIATMVAFIVGVAVGGWGMSKSMVRFIELSAVEHSSSEAVASVTALKLLRAEKTPRAIELLEQQLDSAVITLGVYVSEPPQLPGQALGSALMGIEKARDYRTECPRTNTSSVIAASVAGAFGQLEKWETSHRHD